MDRQQSWTLDLSPSGMERRTRLRSEDTAYSGGKKGRKTGVERVAQTQKNWNSIRIQLQAAGRILYSGAA